LSLEKLCEECKPIVKHILGDLLKKLNDIEKLRDSLQEQLKQIMKEA